MKTLLTTLFAALVLLVATPALALEKDLKEVAFKRTVPAEISFREYREVCNGNSCKLQPFSTTQEFSATYIGSQFLDGYWLTSLPKAEFTSLLIDGHTAVVHKLGEGWAIVKTEGYMLVAPETHINTRIFKGQPLFYEDIKRYRTVQKPQVYEVFDGYAYATTSPRPEALGAAVFNQNGELAAVVAGPVETRIKEGKTVRFNTKLILLDPELFKDFQLLPTLAPRVSSGTL